MLECRFPLFGIAPAFENRRDGFRQLGEDRAHVLLERPPAACGQGDQDRRIGIMEVVNVALVRQFRGTLFDLLEQPPDGRGAAGARKAR